MTEEEIKIILNEKQLLCLMAAQICAGIIGSKDYRGTESAKRAIVERSVDLAYAIRGEAFIE